MSTFKRIILAVIIGVLVIAIGIGGFALYRLNLFPFNAKAFTPAEEHTYSMGEFIANLNESGYKRYIKVTIYFGYGDKKLEKELGEKTPQIRNTLNDILRSKKIDEVGPVEEMKKVISEMKSEVNTILTSGKVVNIYFSDILIQ